MSFHAGQTFTFGEQPSATKWQYVWDNDYALADGTGISNDAILTRHILDANITTRKLKPSTINFTDAGGSNFTTTSGSYVDITGMTTTYNSGPTAERLFVWLEGMTLNSTVASGEVILNINGVAETNVAEYKDDATWDRMSYLVVRDIPASTAVVIKAQGRNSGGATLTWHRASPYLGSIRGFTISQ